MHLTGIRLGGIPPFTDPITLRFDEQVNVFIGPNASGKSTLLLVLAGHFLRSGRALENTIPWDRLIISECPDDEFEEFVQEEEANVISASEDWFGAKYGNFKPEVIPTIIYIGPVREGLSKKLNTLDTYEFGEEAAEVLDGPFSGSRAVCAFELLGLILGELGDELRQNGEDLPYLKKSELRKAGELAVTCCQQICNEVLQEPRLRSFIRDPHALDRLFDPLGDPSDLTDFRSLGIRTTDKPNFEGYSYFEQPARGVYGYGEDSIPLPVSHLSSGTGGSLLWILWLALKLVHHYKFESGTERDPENRSYFKDSWDKKPAILLIDEIENHLHPTWQRRVIPALLEHFPGLQIFATTHSPFVVAGLKAGQVHKLERDANGIVTATTHPQDVIGWTMDEILRVIMEVDEPTDQRTVDRTNRLRQLRDKEILTSEEESELNELRRQVNEDLLNKRGPLEAQRERYADMVQDFLRMRQNELNQDGE